MEKHIRDFIINSFDRSHFESGYKNVIETLVDQGKCITTREHAQFFDVDMNLLPYLSSKPQDWDPNSNIIEIYFDLEGFMETTEYSS